MFSVENNKDNNFQSTDALHFIVRQRYHMVIPWYVLDPLLDALRMKLVFELTLLAAINYCF